MIRSLFIVLFSFVIALILTILPLPLSFRFFRPEWVAFLIIFWGVFAPRYVGLITAWCVGLFLDVLSGTLLGVHALGLTLVAYLTSLLYYRFRIVGISQQTFLVLVMLVLYQAEIALTQGMIGALPDELNWFWLLLSPLLTCCLWPGNYWLQARLSHYFDYDR